MEAFVLSYMNLFKSVVFLAYNKPIITYNNRSMPN